MIDYMDPFGFIGFRRSDGKFDFGDSCQRTMSYYLLVEAHKRLGISGLPEIPITRVIRSISMLHVPGGGTRYRRHPSSEWWSNPKNFSRDQATPLVIVMGLYPLTLTLSAFFRDHLRRGLLFMYNTRRNHQYPTHIEHQLAVVRDVIDQDWDYSYKLPDPTGPGFWALYIRGFRKKHLMPLLWLLDMDYVANSYMIMKKEDYYDISNHLNSLIYAHLVMPTANSKRAFLMLDLDEVRLRLSNYYKIYPWGSDSLEFIELYMRVLWGIKKALKS